MCYNCGCKMPYEDHGDKDNITEEFFERAGKTKAINNTGKVAAKENVHELLQNQLSKHELDSPEDEY